MADLTELRAEDFRAFRQVSILLEPSGLMLVAGPNNVGKSALLSAFDAVAGIDTSATVRHAAGTRARVWARWRLSDDERMALLGNDPKADDLIQQGAASWLEWQFAEFHDRIQPVAARVSWSNPDGLEFTRIEADGPIGWKLYTTSRPLSEWNPGSFDGPSGGHGESIGNTLQILNAGPSVAYAIGILSQWRRGYFHFRPLRESRGRDSQLSNITSALESTGANLATVLLYLQTNRPDVWARLVGLVEQIVPGVGQLMTPVNGSQCSIVFQDEQVPTHQHNLKDLGTGVEQLLMTLVVGLTQDATTVVMEEPETGLHPGAQRALLGLLQDWSKNRLFAASTHSATMLDWTSSSTTVISVSRHGTESTVVLVATERAALLQGLGVRLSDVLSAERILILEGPTDKQIIDFWFPMLTGNPRIAVLEGKGGYNAVHADRLAEWLAAADQLGQRHVLYIRDRDELSAKFLEKLKDSKYVHVLPARELENLLLDFAAITHVINAELATQEKSHVTEAEVSAVAKQAADELKHIVVMKRVMADFADPIRLVDNAMRRRLSKKSGGEAKAALIAEVLARVPEKADIEGRIEASWEEHSEAVEESWADDWLQDVPGADLLKALFMMFLGRGYSKTTDGVTLARAMGNPPELLARVVEAFVLDERDSEGKSENLTDESRRGTIKGDERFRTKLLSQTLNQDE